MTGKGGLKEEEDPDRGSGEKHSHQKDGKCGVLREEKAWNFLETDRR